MKNGQPPNRRVRVEIGKAVKVEITKPNGEKTDNLYSVTHVKRGFICLESLDGDKIELTIQY